MQELLNKYKLIIFDYSDTLVSSNTNCPLISRELLLLLKSKDKKLAIFSAANLEEIEDPIKNFYEGVFDHIITKDSVKNTKPDPEGLNLIVRKMNISNDLCLFVGDSINDKLAAESAGVGFIETSEFIKKSL